ncbi:trimeric LpxA-like protein, partial [Cryphonectria parasitica EP155]
FPYVKMPIYMDYGLRVRIGPTTFINRNCFIMDTPVADIVIGERCQIGPNVNIIGVGHSVKYEERNELETGVAGSWGAKVQIGDGAWIGAGSTILPGVTIGEYSTIGAGSVVTRDVPARCVAVGNPAKVL